MAKNRSKSGGLQGSSSGGSLGGNRRGGGNSGGSTRGRQGGSSELRGLSSERSRSQALQGSQGSPGSQRSRGSESRGMMAGAREFAGNLAGSTARQARGVAESVRDTAVEVGRTTQGAAGQVAGYVREHPWPALLIGAGATWLAVDAARGRSDDQGSSHASSHAQNRSRDAESNMMSRTLSSIGEAGRGAGQQVQEFVRENPLLAGAAALGVGVAVGMALPGTLPENRALGDARDAVVRRAKSLAEGTMRSVRDLTDNIMPE